MSDPATLPAGGTDGPVMGGLSTSGTVTPAAARAIEVIERTLAETGVSFERPRHEAFLVRLEGRHKLVTMCWLIVEDHALHVEAFFCRQPDENHAEFYRFLLTRNGGTYGVHFALDPVGDVYLVGRVALESVSAEEIDRLLGCVLTYADENFDRALELGFASAIRREWDWRLKRGESLANLQAFARFADPARRTDGAGRPGSGPSGNGSSGNGASENGAAGDGATGG